MMVLCAAAAQAGSDGPNNPSFLLFAGTDLWRDGAFVDGGLLWPPAGLNTGGLTFKILLNGGLYTYPSGGLHTDVEGTLVSAAALPGWRTTRDGFTIDLYAGPIVQDYRLRTIPAAACAGSTAERRSRVTSGTSRVRRP
jgi:hypothetical protein